MAIGMDPNNPALIQLPPGGFYKLPEAAKCSRVICENGKVSFRLELSTLLYVDVHCSWEAIETLYDLLTVQLTDQMGDPQGSA